MATEEEEARKPERGARTPWDGGRSERTDETRTQSRQQMRVALGIDPCPDCGSIHPSRWARWQAVGRLRPGDLVGAVCAARSPLMRNVYGSIWRVLEIEATSRHRFPKLVVEAVEAGPWLREGEEPRADVDGRDVFPVAENAPEQHSS